VRVQVYKARYNGSYVAVKQLKKSDMIALGDFRTEMSVLRRMHHPNAVQFLGACTRKEPYIIVTELMSCSLMTAFVLTFRLSLRRQVRLHHPLPTAHCGRRPTCCARCAAPSCAHACASVFAVR
jgi:serine/threonine protein kinase